MFQNIYYSFASAGLLGAPAFSKIFITVPSGGSAPSECKKCSLISFSESLMHYEYIISHITIYCMTLCRDSRQREKKIIMIILANLSNI